MSEIRIGNHIIAWDGTCWTTFVLSCRGSKSKSPGEEYRKPIAYYAKLDGSLRDLLNEKLGESDAKDCQEVIEAIGRACTEIIAALECGVRCTT